MTPPIFFLLLDIFSIPLVFVVKNYIKFPKDPQISGCGEFLCSISHSFWSSLVQGTKVEMGGHVKLNSNKSLIKRRRVKKRSSMKREFPINLILQELYASCKTVFKGPGFVPSPSDVQSLCRILDKMEPEDLGLSKNLHFFNPSSANAAVGENVRVTYTNVYKCKNFSLVLFFLPAMAVIPLHNHPDMTVFNKLLLGEIHVKSYDMVDDTKQPSGLRLARLKSDTVYTAPCDTKVLFPASGGNIHQLTAITPSVVLDVIGPPYSKEDDRDCTYYRDLPFDAAIANQDSELANHLVDGEKYGWLEEIETPEGSGMDGILYLGPRIVESLW